MHKYINLGQNLFVNMQGNYKLTAFEESTLPQDLQLLEDMFNECVQDIYDFAGQSDLEFLPSHTNSLICYLEYCSDYSEISGQYFEIQNHIAVMRYTDIGGLVVDNLSGKQRLKKIITKELLNLMFTNVELAQDKDGETKIVRYYLGTNNPYNAITGEIEQNTKYGFMIHEMLVSYLASVIAKSNYEPYIKEFSDIIKRYNIAEIFDALKSHNDNNIVQRLTNDEKKLFI